MWDITKWDIIWAFVKYYGKRILFFELFIALVIAFILSVMSLDTQLTSVEIKETFILAEYIIHGSMVVAGIGIWIINKLG